jgi:UDP:flavonoid glycosyltransferase YjiC (YdhE family)
VVLFPTNGVGFGHFTRMYALARRLREQDPEVEIVMFTSMPTLHVPYADDFVTYHLAGRKKHGELSASSWNGLLEDMLRVVLDLHKPAVFVFDGAFPYRGMLNAIQGEENLCKVWMKRGMFREGARVPVDSISFFDSLIFPGDAVTEQSKSQHNDVEETWVNPMLVYEPSELLERSTARRRLGLPQSARVVYVQLGAGRINDIHSEIRVVLDALLSNSDVHIVLGESMLGERLEFDFERVQILRDYPNMLMFNAFDYSIQAGGYNSFHEMRSLQIPTLFLPNMETGMDDQKSRCEVAFKEGWGLVNDDRSARALTSDVERLLSMTAGSASVADTLNGARQVASIVQEKVNSHVGL